MKRIVFATGNQNKMKEIRMILEDLGMPIYSMKELGIEEDIVEDGETFEENALIKARAIAKQFNQVVIADDSGLEVDALHGRPGVYSARYAGEGRDDQANIKKVLSELEGIPTEQRGARFVCALALVTPEGEESVVRGTCEGQILTECLGSEGFGYDPIFYLPELEKTMAQIPKHQKNVLSHRADAFAKLQTILMNLV